MIPLVATLATSGLSFLSEALLTKGREWIKEKTGVDLPPNETTALSPEQFAALHQANAAVSVELTKAAKEIELAEINDVAIARKLQEATLMAHEGWFATNFIYLLTVFWSCVSSAYIGFITFGNVPKENQRYADTILGFILGTAIASIFTYFYGTTRSSGKKDSVVSRILDKLTNVSK